MLQSEPDSTGVHQGYAGGVLGGNNYGASQGSRNPVGLNTSGMSAMTETLKRNLNRQFGLNIQGFNAGAPHMMMGADQG